MKYYVYAGYYENFISGHKLPKPYTLRDEFKTFDEALDYVLENWEDDAIFFTEDVIGDAIDNGFINDEDWENYLMEESKNSTRKSIKESINGDCYIYFDDNGEIYGKNRRWVFCDNVKGITDTRDFFSLNDFIIDAIHIFKNEKQAQKFIDEHLKYFEDKDKVVIAEYPQTVSEFYESKESARKSIKESINYEVEGLYFFNFDVGETCSIDLKDAFNADGVISEFYKNENRIYSIVVCSAIDYCFFISYDYRKKKVIYSECFSSYQNAKNKMRDWLKNI